MGTVALPGAGELRWFIEQWYERSGLPTWSVKWTHDGRLHASVTQPPPHYRATIDVLVESSGRSSRQRLDLSGPTTDVVWPVDFRVSSVTLDPDYEVPHITQDRRSEADVLVPVAGALRLLREGGGSDFLEAARLVYSELPDAEAPHHRFARDTIEYDEACKRGDIGLAHVHLERALANPFRLPALLPEMHFVRTASCVSSRGFLRPA